MELEPEVEVEVEAAAVVAVEVVVALDMVQVTAPDMVRAAVRGALEGMVEEEEVEAAVAGEKEEVKALAPVPGMATALALDTVKVPAVGVLVDTVEEAAEVAAGEKGLVKARDMGLAMAMDPATVLVLVLVALRVEVTGVVEVAEAAVERARAPAPALVPAQATMS
ncbi:hypothetical protein C4D60_Mb05t21430 [Musa balbisiana]|uniref:Uncharacterized protein n=1 Tax=Musa balbisiana TaxID=52838 RepID=A0A4S8JXT3_MUSBA|nr:hypothetical protein C4D60_Mb05t21430 [Musa balbisiana]